MIQNIILLGVIFNTCFNEEKTQMETAHLNMAISIRSQNIKNAKCNRKLCCFIVS